MAFFFGRLREYFPISWRRWPSTLLQKYTFPYFLSLETQKTCKVMTFRTSSASISPSDIGTDTFKVGF